MKHVDNILTTMEEVDRTSAAMGQSQLKNKYYVCLGYRKEPIPWNPLDEKQDINYHTAYFGKVFVAMEQSLLLEGLTFYLTWNIQTLPSYGQDVVAVVLGEEWSRIPKYFNRVRALFKCYGTRLPLGGNFFTNPSYLNFLSLVRYLRIQVHRVPGVVHYVAEKTKAYLRSDKAREGAIFDIPVGYANQAELPMKPITSRRYDLYFSGSVDNQVYPFWKPQRWLQTPKSISRKQMIASVNELKKKRPDLNIEIDITPSFTPRLLNVQKREGISGGGPRARSYSEEMMDTKICLVPRGTTPETPRHYEGMRYGCVLITETLPARWYLDGAPVIQVRDWGELGRVVEELLGDERLLQKKHTETLSWWRSTCSETAVGAFIAEQINATLVNRGSKTGTRQHAPETHAAEN